MTKRRKFERQIPTRSYRRMFVLATEGAETEPQYFDLFNSRLITITIKCLRSSTDSAPVHVLKRMERHLQSNRLRPGDAAWLVVDKDRWTDEQLTQLYAWANTDDQHGFAVSNPGFELWLLLHFENGSGVANIRHCRERLRRYLPNYDKTHVETAKLLPGISAAIDRARMKDTPPCPDWPRTVGTTVYLLVEKLQNS